MNGGGWRGPAEWDADMHDNFKEGDRILKIAIELGMNSSVLMSNQIA